MRAGQRALGEQHARGLLLGVGVGDVEPHPARPGGADLEVRARFRLQHRLVEDLDVADELRQGVRGQQRLEALAEVAAVLQDLVGVAARLVDVLVGDAGGGVHGVHDDVRPPLGDELVQVVLRGGGVGQRVDEALDHARAQRAVAVDLAARPVLGLREGEDVAPGRMQGDAFGLRAEAGHRLFRFFFLQGQQRQLARLLLKQPARDRLPDEPVSAEDQDALAADVHRSEV